MIVYTIIQKCDLQCSPQMIQSIDKSRLVLGGTHDLRSS